MMNLSKFIPISVLLASMVSFAGPVSHFGKIISCGGNLCGEKTGTSVPIQLKGPSLYWSTGDPAVLFHPATVDWFVNNFEIGVIRAPMAIKYYKENSEPISASDGNNGVTSYGYLSTPAGYNEKGNQKKLIKDVVDAAIANDIYVIVDWHSHNASRETNEAVTFFKDMATEYKDVPNLIWEIYNEPVSDDAGAINNYAKSVVAAIRNAGNNNLVVVGTPFYSSQPNQQVSQGLHNTYSNIAYTLHFYAAANHDGYKSNGSSAMSSAPIFITEWGASDASGDGNISDASSWRSWMDQNKVSGCMWYAGTGTQSSAMFPEGTTVLNLDNAKSRFSGINTSAGVFNAYISTNKWKSFVPSTHPLGNTIVASVSEGASKVFSSELGIRGAISAVADPVSGSVTFTDNSITFNSAEYGSPEQIIINYNVTQGSVTIQERIVIKMTDRKPILADTTLSVSYKEPKKLKLSTIGASNPISKVASSMSITAATVSAGSIVFSGDSMTFTPPGTPGLVTLNYTAQNANGTASATINLICENQAPTIYAKANMGSKPNTAPIYISLHTVRAKDADGDPLTFGAYYLDPNYTGTLTINATKDTLIYTPDGAHTGTITILSVLTDSQADSKIGSAVFTLTGSGTAVNVAAPTTIPGYVPLKITEKSKNIYNKSNINLMIHKNEINLSVAQSGIVSVDLFDIQGHKIKTLLNESLNAGNFNFSWDPSGMPAGHYVIRMKQGSMVNYQKFINR
jgi:hypothetical protein